jgi:glucokinase
LASLVNIFNPEMIVIGGSVSKMGSMLFDPAIAVVQDRAFPLLSRAVSIVRAQNIDDAGLLGAAAFAFQQRVRQEEVR